MLRVARGERRARKKRERRSRESPDADRQRWGGAQVNVTMVFRDVASSERLRESVHERSEQLGRYFQAIQHVEWDFKRDGEDVALRCRLRSKSGFYRAQARASRASRALDEAGEKLLKQRRRFKQQRFRTRRVTR